MDIIQCKLCRKPFQSMGGRICGNCLQEIDLEFIKIRDYLYDHPGHWSAEQLSRETGVSKPVILHLINEKRLIIEDVKGSGGICEVCKKPLSEGTMCDECKKALASKLQGTLPQPKAPEKKTDDAVNRPRMHIDRRDR